MRKSKDIINVIIVEDYELMSEGLKMMLEKIPEVQVLETIDSGLKTIERLKIIKPDIIFLDIGLPDINGLEVLKKIRPLYPELRIAMLSMSEEPGDIEKAKKYGANVFLSKTRAFDEIKTFIFSKTSEFYSKIDISKSQNWRAILTSREIEVIFEIVKGKTAKKISEELNISKFTVDTHRKNILSKLNLNKIAELIKWAIANGLCDTK